MNPIISITEASEDYELLDSGDGEKLERYGSVLLRRPDPQALWKKSDENLWKNADAYFTREGRDGKWNFIKTTPEKWTIKISDLKFNIRPTAFKHTGIFPEHAPSWQWLVDRIKKYEIGNKNGEPAQILNLFGYTGGATLACAQAGAKVCHVDASKASITWAKDNAEVSGLSDKPIRWMLDDAKDFVQKEIRRGNKYDGIITDPPAFGRGPEGQVWQIEDDFVKFVEECKKLLSDKPIFFLVNGYASGYSSLAYLYNVNDLVEKYGGEVESGELTIREKASGRLLPCGIFARWYA